jgi:hypothetical protein
MNIPATKAGISQSRDTNFRLHNATQDLPLLEALRLFSSKHTNPTKPILEQKHADENLDVPCLKHLMTMTLNFKGGHKVRGIGRTLR